MATLTINTVTADDVRIAAAFGTYLGLPGAASGPQVKATVISFVTGIVKNAEERALKDAVTTTPIAPS